MVTTNILIEKSAEITKMAQSLNIELYITEDYQSTETQYKDPSNIIFKKNSPEVSISEGQLHSLTESLKSVLKDHNIKLIFENSLKNKNALFNEEESKHLLSSAIDISKVRNEKPWKDQFKEERAIKKAIEALPPFLRGVEIEVAENVAVIPLRPSTSPASASGKECQSTEGILLD